jgi:hypothetical protein
MAIATYHESAWPLHWQQYNPTLLLLPIDPENLKRIPCLPTGKTRGNSRQMICLDACITGGVPSSVSMCTYTLIRPERRSAPW